MFNRIVGGLTGLVLAGYMSKRYYNHKKISQGKCVNIYHIHNSSIYIVKYKDMTYDEAVFISLINMPSLLLPCQVFISHESDKSPSVNLDDYGVMFPIYYNYHSPINYKIIEKRTEEPRKGLI